MFLDIVAFVVVLFILGWCFLLVCGLIGVMLERIFDPDSEAELGWSYVWDGFVWFVCVTLAGKGLFWCFDRVMVLLT